ncbi:hypothetical protein Q428_08890 [Fervidicella metallireducens AeB]|uniref:HTH cro/C1-type domain-containing protein n=1 Tax=Fervidicella metallireducens AeB TaxID=1403537 RepID=A0A017RUE6_9CLOT|nr:helix-turn-helix transcriptional regulator [Fervidicella metallireducens]EYE88307.1 hypothetical protein Q428_08890 [Fervidicella metallireducens AeB]
MAKPYKELTPFGKWVKIKLIEKNMTVTELAEKVGTTKHRISEITRGVIPGNRYKDLIVDVLADGEEERKKLKAS